MENLKILILKNDVVLIAKVVEVEVSTFGEPDCKLVNPYKVWKDNLTNQFGMRRWPEHTNQNEIIIHSDSILTIVEPTEEHIKLYLNTIK